MPQLIQGRSTTRSNNHPLLYFNGSSLLIGDTAPLPEAAKDYTIVYVNRPHTAPRVAEINYEMLDSATGDGYTEGVIGSQ
jgi:hypothetical protein